MKLIGIAAGLVAIVATVTLAFTQAGRSSPSGPVGPEGASIPDGRPLALPRALTARERISGIVCQTREKVLWHTHAHLTLFVDGKPKQVPAGIGIGAPREVASTARGAFVVAGSCFAWLHTHAADGIIHTESPVRRTYTLGQFFDVWGQPLTDDDVGPAHGRVTAFVDGRLYTGDPRDIRLLRHAQIQLDIGSPAPEPERITFAPGL